MQKTRNELIATIKTLIDQHAETIHSTKSSLPPFDSFVLKFGECSSIVLHEREVSIDTSLEGGTSYTLGGRDASDLHLYCKMVTLRHLEKKGRKLEEDVLKSLKTFLN